MPDESNTITIARPVGDVFAFLVDAENDTRWRGGVIEMTRTSEQGTTYRQIAAGPGGRQIDAGDEITEFVSDQRIAFRTTHGPVVDGELNRIFHHAPLSGSIHDPRQPGRSGLNTLRTGPKQGHGANCPATCARARSPVLLLARGPGIAWRR
jgi:hypothetical protein